VIRRERAPGEPLVALLGLLAAWVGVRTLAWTMDPAEVVPPAEPLAASVPQAAYSVRQLRSVAARPVPAAIQPVPLWTAEPVRPPLAPASLAPASLAPLPASPVPVAQAVPAPAPTSPVEHRMMVAGGHQLLWLAATAMLPMPADLADPAAPGPNRMATTLPRWSADGWVFLRRGGSLVTFPRVTGGGTYGASQAGAVLRYRIDPDSAHRPTAYLRGAGALNGTREQEVAVGLAVRPLARLPVAAMAEVRATRNASGTSARPAVALVTELPPQRLPLGFTGEAYVQAGYVGGRYATAYVDGLVRAERKLIAADGFAARAGGGVWGARQRGAARLDIGPVASVTVRLNDAASARIEADWRFRVAGEAHPGSGPALTLSAGF